MIVTFNYSEQGVTDPRPLLLFLHYNKDNKVLEGLNMNYINPAKLKKLFSVIEFKKGKLDEQENLLSLKQNYFRIQISNPKRRSAISSKRFYGDDFDIKILHVFFEDRNAENQQFWQVFFFDVRQFYRLQHSHLFLNDPHQFYIKQYFYSKLEIDIHL